VSKPKCYYKLCGCTANECCCEYYFPADADEEQLIYERELAMSRDRGYENIGSNAFEKSGMGVHDGLLEYMLYEQRTNHEWQNGEE
jgi:hypothetical protein